MSLVRMIVVVDGAMLLLELPTLVNSLLHLLQVWHQYHNVELQWCADSAGAYVEYAAHV